MEDKKETIICVECDQQFELTEGWKRLLKENPDIQKPKRCYSCRQRRKEEKKEEGEIGTSTPHIFS